MVTKGIIMQRVGGGEAFTTSKKLHLSVPDKPTSFTSDLWDVKIRFITMKQKGSHRTSKEIKDQHLYSGAKL